MCMLQSLIRSKPVQYRLTSILKACRNHLSQTPPSPPPPQTSHPAAAVSLGGEVVGESLKRYENPCLDLYFSVIPQKPATFVHLNRLLPSAWSHNPLTTLKIIRSYYAISYGVLEDKTEEVVFNRAVYWLHHNHPKTLAFNLPYLAASGHYDTFIEILYRVLDLKAVFTIGDHERDRFREALDRYPDFRLLHDRISDLYAESLKFDIQNFNNHGEEEIFEVTDAAQSISEAPFLLESVAQRVFPGFEDAVDRLRKEVLEPLKKVLDYENRYDMNPWGYRLVDDDVSLWDRFVDYLEEVKESPDKMVADALVPLDILCFLSFEHLRPVLELQWKTMVEDLKKKYKERMQGILSNSLAVIHPDKYLSPKIVDQSLALSLTILISELSEEEAWKGKFIPLTPEPRLLSIQGDDLMSKCEFLKEGDDNENHRCTDFKRVFDLILQEAVDRSLKPEQMIRRVYVLAVKNERFDEISVGNWDEQENDEKMPSKWQAQDYEEMKNKYKDHGYDLPYIVFWRIFDHLEPVQHSPDERGIVTMSGFPKDWRRPTYANFVKVFLENDGEMSPQHVMEANLSLQVNQVNLVDQVNQVSFLAVLD